MISCCLWEERKKHNMKVLASLYCGNGTYLDNPEMVTGKLSKLVQKLNPDMVSCGPAYNFKDYALMAAHTAAKIARQTDIKVLAAMCSDD